MFPSRMYVLHVVLCAVRVAEVCVWVCVHRALAGMKVRLKGAQQGYNLLKKKADALTSRFRAILKKIVEVRVLHHHFLHVSNLLSIVGAPQNKTKMGEIMRTASFSLAEATYAAGDFR